MANFTNNEYVDMLQVFFECHKNCAAATRLYHERYPNRRVPHRQTFSAVERRLRETGQIQPKREGNGQRRYIRNVNLEEAILINLEENPQTSTRRLATQYNVSQSLVWNLIHDNLLRPFHHQPVQELTANDLPARIVFCQWYLNMSRHDLNFLSHILFTDEACFQRHGLVNHRNSHTWSDENPHEICPSRFQHNFSVNVWSGIVGDALIGPFILPRRLTALEYLRFLNENLPILLEDIPLGVRQVMWYMHDGAPAHSTLAVRQWLNLNFPGRWIGRGVDAPVSWPARSPDITPLDYFLWGQLKSLVYATPVNTVEELRQKIFLAADDIRNNPEIFARVRHNFNRRVRLCLQKNGNYFENIL